MTEGEGLHDGSKSCCDGCSGDMTRDTYMISCKSYKCRSDDF